MGANAAATPSIQRPAGVSAPTPLDVSAGVATVTQNQTISTPGATKRSGPAAGRPVEKYVSADQVGSDSTVAENVAVSATDAKDSAVPMPAAQLPSTGTAAVWEKTAVAHLYASDSSKNANLPEQKSFLKAGSETVTASASGVGTGVARVTASMPPAASNRPKTSPVAEAGLMGTAAGAKLPTLEFKADAPAPVATLRETMSAVVSAVDALERQINAGHGAVDLQFHVGDQQLALRVELRDGTVHTTFRTDSSELRSALSQEWQSMVQPASGREVRLADPVFSSGPATGGDAASGSLGQGTPQRHTQNPPEPTSFNLPRNLAAPAVPEPAATAAVSSNSNQLLSAFA
jgi:hypothetical protein